MYPQERYCNVFPSCLVSPLVLPREATSHNLSQRLTTLTMSPLMRVALCLLLIVFASTSFYVYTFYESFGFSSTATSTASGMISHSHPCQYYLYYALSFEAYINKHHAAPRSTTQHHAASRSTTQHHAAPRSTTQYHAAPHNTDYSTYYHVL